MEDKKLPDAKARRTNWPVGAIVVDDCPYCHKEHCHKENTLEDPLIRAADCMSGEYRLVFE